MSQLHDAEVEFVIHTPKVGGKKKFLMKLLLYHKYLTSRFGEHAIANRKNINSLHINGCKDMLYLKS
jgi:hypothetical protein